MDYRNCNIGNGFDYRGCYIRPGVSQDGVVGANFRWDNLSDGGLDLSCRADRDGVTCLDIIEDALASFIAVCLEHLQSMLVVVERFGLVVDRRGVSFKYGHFRVVIGSCETAQDWVQERTSLVVEFVTFAVMV